MLKTEEISVSYGKIAAVKNVSIQVKPNTIVAIIGANGAGKTTLINAVMGFVQPQSGRIFIGGKNITCLPPWERAKAGMAIVPEGGRIFRDLSVKENLLLGAYTIKDKFKIQKRIKEIFQIFPIMQERYHQIAGTLSGGERQMLSIARALMSFPKVLIIDEISMGLMPRLVDDVMEVVYSLKSKGVTVLIAEQNTKEVLDIADEAYVMQNGMIVMSGTSANLKNDPKIKESYLGM